MSAPKSKALFGYWNVRGLGQPIRFLLAYLKIDYEEKTYDFGPPPDLNKLAWEKDKLNLGLHFPNLPYYIDGPDSPNRITQSKAILKYLSRTYDTSLMASTPDMETQFNMLEEFLRDLWEAISELVWFYTDSAAKSFEVDQKLKLKQLSEYLGDNKWLFGDKLSYVDFIMYEVLKRQTAYNASWLHSNFVQYIERFEALPEIRNYLNKADIVWKPFTGPAAKRILCLEKPN